MKATNAAKSGLVEKGLVEEELRNVDVGSVISSCYAEAVRGTSIDWNIAVEPVQAVLRLLLGEAVNRTLSFVLVIQAVGYPALVVELAGGTLVGPFLGDGGGVGVLAVTSFLEVGGGGGPQLASDLGCVARRLGQEFWQRDIVLLGQLIGLRWQGEAEILHSGERIRRKLLSLRRSLLNLRRQGRLSRGHGGSTSNDKSGGQGGYGCTMRKLHALHRAISGRQSGRSFRAAQVIRYNFVMVPVFLGKYGWWDNILTAQFWSTAKGC